LLIVPVLFISCDNKFEPPKSNLNAEDTPEHESWNSQVTFSDSGTIKAVLKAGEISVFNKKGYTLIDSGAIVDFYNKGEKVSTLTSKRGKILEPSKDIEIYDSVVVISKEGSMLRTQKLLWNNKTQRVSSDIYVKITTPKEEVEGIGFESDQMLKNYTIFKVTGTFSK
jgi:LPS export ABC transporter protein LptC